MAKIAVLNDTHFGVKGGSDVLLNNQAEFFRKVFFPKVEEEGISQILHLGDLYDSRKAIDVKTQHAARKMFLEPMRNRGMMMDIIPGNHDVYYKSTNSINSLKEMLGYFLNNIHIIEEPETMTYSGMQIGLVPWINSENEDQCMEFIRSKCKSSWLAGHFEIAGFDMMRGVKSTHGLDASVFDRYESVLSGHYHSGSQKGNIKYLGSQSEFTWADADDPKYFHIIDTSTREIEHVRNPYTLYRKLYYDDSGEDSVPSPGTEDIEGKYVKVFVTHKEDPKRFDSFIQSLYDQKVHDLKIAESFDEYLGSSVDLTEGTTAVQVEDTTSLIDSYVESLDTDLKKDRLKNIMRSVYVEAQSEDTV